MSEVCTVFLKGKQWGHNLNEIAFRFSFSEYYIFRSFLYFSEGYRNVTISDGKKLGKKLLLKR